MRINFERISVLLFNAWININARNIDDILNKIE